MKKRMDIYGGMEKNTNKKRIKSTHKEREKDPVQHAIAALAATATAPKPMQYQ